MTQLSCLSELHIFSVIAFSKWFIFRSEKSNFELLK